MSTVRMYPGGNRDEAADFAPYSAFEIPHDLRQLHGDYGVDAMARRVRNFRYAEEWMMMILGGWIATIPEVPVKMGLGKIVWECAQSADKLGNRLPELRCGRHVPDASLPANDGFAALLQKIAEPETPDLTIEKLTGVFDVLKPHMLAVYKYTRQETDQICDAPTVELLDDIVRWTEKHISWSAEVLDRLCDTDAKRERRRARASEIEALLRECGGVTGTPADAAAA